MSKCFSTYQLCWCYFFSRWWRKVTWSHCRRIMSAPSMQLSLQSFGASLHLFLLRFLWASRAVASLAHCRKRHQLRRGLRHRLQRENCCGRLIQGYRWEHDFGCRVEEEIVERVCWNNAAARLTCARSLLFAPRWSQNLRYLLCTPCSSLGSVSAHKQLSYLLMRKARENGWKTLTINIDK